MTPSPSRTRLTGAFSRVVLVRAAMMLAGAGMAWFVLDGWTKRELAVERRALEARAIDLTNRALMPGSALACLDASAGDTVEASCEKALFATPESTASAVSYVAAQLAHELDRRGGRASCREYIINDEHPVVAREGVLVDIELIGAVLELIRMA